MRILAVEEEVAEMSARHAELYQHLEFGVHGAPADHAAVHGYDRTSYNGGNSSARPGHASGVERGG